MTYTLPALPSPANVDIWEKSRETMQWLQENVLVGYVDERGPAWWSNAITKNGAWEMPAGSHFPGAVPMKKVTKLLDVRLVKGTSYVKYLDDEDNEQVVQDTENIPVVNASTGRIFGYPKEGYAIHPYLPTLKGFMEKILHDESVAVGSAGLLRHGGVAFLQARLPEHYEVQGYGYVPYLSAVTSVDRSRKTTYLTGILGAVCHASGTFIIDGDWRGLVEDHPSFKGTIRANGREVTVRGVPFPEYVSDDHAYWVRERRRSLKPSTQKRLGVTSAKIGKDTDPGWVRASDLSPVIHEIGMPIDMTENPVIPGIDDLESAWMLGYLWGNGHLERGNRVTFSIPDARDDLITRIVAYAKAHGWTGNVLQRQGCVTVSFSNPVLRRALEEFKQEGWGQKVPAVWAEKAPLDWQRSLVQGYYAADGNTDTTEGCILLSVSLDGLLSLRRILARLGVPSSIRRGSDPSLRSEIQGRQVNAQEIYSIRFWVNADQFGYETRFKGMFSHPYIEDGWIWSRVENVNDWTGEVCPITTDTHEYLSDLGKSHNCDNTVDASILGAYTKVAIRHSRNSGIKVQDARDKLGIQLAQVGDEAAEGIENLLKIDVSPREFAKWLDLAVPLPEYKETKAGTGGKGYTQAENKRNALEALWEHDPKVKPWAGTAFGVLQLDNTFRTWDSVVRGMSGGRLELNFTRDIQGKTTASDKLALSRLATVKRRKTLLAVA